MKTRAKNAFWLFVMVVMALVAFALVVGIVMLISTAFIYAAGIIKWAMTDAGFW